MTPAALTPPTTPPLAVPTVSLESKLTFTLTDPTHWSYLTRGANNILYSYTPPAGVPVIPSLHHYLLRLRIACPGTPSTTFLFNALQDRYLPNLPDGTVLDTKIVRLGSGFIAGLQGGLAELQAHFEGFGIEGSPGRRKKGKVVRLDEKEEWGLLVQDMRLPRGHGGDLDEAPVLRNDRTESEPRRVGEDVEVPVALMEFKPKYLSQSADAPEGWSVCRTCAYRAKVGYGAKDPPSPKSVDCGEGEDEDEEAEMYCPLDLASLDRKRVERAVKCIVETKGCSSRVDVNYWGLLCLKYPWLWDESLNVEKFGGSKRRMGMEEEKEEMEAAVKRFLKRCLTEHFLDSETSKLIETSTRLQREWGKAGVFPSLSMSEDMDPEGIWYALGLVDCTIYMRVSVRIPLSVARQNDLEKGHVLDLNRRIGDWKRDVRIECRVGDLDPKVGTGAQGVFFKNQERSLSRGGWYFGEEGVRSCRDGRRIGGE